MCPRCKTPRLAADFYDRGSYCRPCTRSYVLDWRKRYPGRRRAHVLVARALKEGRLIRPKACARCSKHTVVVAHHENYRRPLTVVWLCDQCHAIRHAELGRRRPTPPKTLPDGHHRR